MQEKRKENFYIAAELNVNDVNNDIFISTQKSDMQWWKNYSDPLFK